MGVEGILFPGIAGAMILVGVQQATNMLKSKKAKKQ